jgi:hypothetical protein
MSQSLQFYIQDASSLLWDYGLAFTPQKQLIRWINESRRQIAQKTGCIRRHLTGQSAYGASSQPGQFLAGGAQPGALPGAFPNAQTFATQNTFQALVGVERYSFDWANRYLQASYAGVDKIIDVGTVSVSWGASPLPALAWLPWDDLQAYARAYATLVTSYPYYWSVLNDGEHGEVWLFPVPSQQTWMEWDVYCAPKDINTDDDYDAVPPGFRNAVKFGATAMALRGKRLYADAEYMDGKFNERLFTGSVARDRGKVPNYYYDTI